MPKTWIGALVVWSVLLSPIQPAVAQAPLPLWSFDTIPASGDITGMPNQTVGWGYTITNQDATDFLAPSALDAGGFTFAVPNPAGVFDFPIVPPGMTVSLDYGLGMGLYEVTVNGGAPPGSIDTGTFVLHADWFDADPTAGANLLFSDQTMEAPYSLTVVAGTPAAVSGPSTWWLVASSLTALAAWRRSGFRRKRSTPAGTHP